MTCTLCLLCKWCSWAFLPTLRATTSDPFYSQRYQRIWMIARPHAHGKCDLVQHRRLGLCVPPIVKSQTPGDAKPRDTDMSTASFAEVHAGSMNLKPCRLDTEANPGLTCLG